MFNYPEVVEENTTKQGRVYYIQHNNKKYNGLYSVTTLLSKVTDTKKAIEDWRNKVGHTLANEITNNSINKGNWMHDILYYRMVGVDYSSKFKKNFLFDIAEKMADSVEVYLNKNLTTLWGAEVPLFIPTMYAGRVDCVGIYDGKQSIIDFKNSYKEKKEAHMHNYKLQCAAYAIAHDFLFDTNIEQGVILICNSSDITTREIIIKGQEWDDVKKEWINLVDVFLHS